MTDNPEQAILRSWSINARPWINAIGNAEIATRVQVTNTAVVDAVLSAQPRTTLDVGCGEGWLTRALTAAGVDTLGIDAVPELIAHAETLGAGRFAVLSYDELTPERIGQRFDCVVCNFSLFGEDSTRRVFAAVPALLQTGGRFVVQTLHPTALAAKDRFTDGWREGSWRGFNPAFSAPPPWYYRTLSSWIRLFERSGFTLHAVEEPALADTGHAVSQLFVATLTDRREPGAGESSRED